MFSLKTAQGENQALSYRNMRAIIGYIGLTLPLVLLVTGIVDGHIETSISTYYYTKVGNVFTGSLCVIGVFLLAYRLAALAIDNVITTIAGVCALGVAFFHAAPQHPTLNQARLADVHLTCAGALFFLLGVICVAIFPQDVLPSQKWRVYLYRTLGGLIFVSIALMLILNNVAHSFYNEYHIFFILETICVMAFAVAFIVKGHGRPGEPRFDKMAHQISAES